MRRCIHCGEEKDESQFNWRDQKKGYLQSVCRDCQQQQGRDRYETDKDNVKSINRAARVRAIDEAQRFVYEYLSNAKCEDCGEYDFSVLTFHHIRSKRMNISDMAAQGYAIEAIRAEIANTIVLCFNCHMRRENEERSGGRFRRFWPRWPWEK